jgi:hypothetical protein
VIVTPYKLGMRSCNFTSKRLHLQSAHVCRSSKIGRLCALGVGPSAALVRYLGLGPKSTLPLPLLPPVFSFLARVGEASAAIGWCLRWSPGTCSRFASPSLHVCLLEVSTRAPAPAAARQTSRPACLVELW